MKKKNLLLILVLICVLSLSLTACNSEDFTGEATVRIELDKVYEDVAISCPGAEVKAITNTIYECSFKNTLPVEIIVGAKGMKNITLKFSNKDLKAGNIEEHVTLEKTEYSMEFTIKGANEGIEFTPQLVNGNGIELEKLSKGTFVLKSNSRIENNVELSIGEDYYNIIIDKENIVYALGNYGKIKDEINPIQKDHKSCLVHSKEPLVLIPKDNASTFINIQGNNFISPNDYYVLRDVYSRIIIKTIKKEELKVDGMYTLSIDSVIIKSDMDFYNIEVVGKKSESFTRDVFDNNGYYVGRENVLYPLEPLEAGDVLYLGQHYYMLKEEDLKKDILNINVKDLKYIEENAPINCQIDIVDKDGNQVNYELYYDGTTITNNIPFIYQPYSQSIYFQNPITHEYIDVDPFYEELIVRYAFRENDEPIKLVLKVKDNSIVSNNITIEYVDNQTQNVIEKSEITYEDNMFLWLDKYCVPEGYTVVDKSVMKQGGEIKIPYSSDFNTTKTIRLEVEKYETVPLIIENINEFDIYYGGSAMFECKNCQFKNISVDPNMENLNLSYLAKERGKTLVYEMNQLPWNFKYTRVYFIVTIPEKGNDAITTRIVAVEDEWLEDNQNGMYH